MNFDGNTLPKWLVELMPTMKSTNYDSHPHNGSYHPLINGTWIRVEIQGPKKAFCRAALHAPRDRASDQTTEAKADPGSGNCAVRASELPVELAFRWHVAGLDLPNMVSWAAQRMTRRSIDS